MSLHFGWKPLAAPLAMIAPCAGYAVDYLAAEQAQPLLFPKADAFTKIGIHLSGEQKDRIKARSGIRQRTDSPGVWKATEGGKTIGWVIVDEVIGKHEYITFAAGISVGGRVEGVEILSYRETHGDGVRAAEWRNRFKGKTLADPFALDRDIPNLAGATLSCRNVMNGVKRMLALREVVLPDE